MHKESCTTGFGLLLLLLTGCRNEGNTPEQGRHLPRSGSQIRDSKTPKPGKGAGSRAFESGSESQKYEQPGAHWKPALPKSVNSAHGKLEVLHSFSGEKGFRDWARTLKPPSTVIVAKIDDKKVGFVLYPGFAGRRAYFAFAYVEMGENWNLLFIENAGVDFLESAEPGISVQLDGDVLKFSDVNRVVGQIEFRQGRLILQGG